MQLNNRLPNEDMLVTLEELCAFRSVAESSPNPLAPYGIAVNQALHYALSLCGRFGFRTKNGGEQYGWAEIGAGKALFGILVHLDVVPAGGGWFCSPYSATVQGGKIYGRGVVDDKGPAVACIYAMKDLLDAKIPLRKRVRIIFGQSEETGDWTDLQRYGQQEEMPVMGFTPDAFFPVVCGEKGLLTYRLSMPLSASGLICASGGTAANMVPDKADAEVHTPNGVHVFAATGKAAHASTPEAGENAISAVMQKLAASGLDCKFARFYNACIGSNLHGAGLGIAFQDAISGSLTLNAGLLETQGDAITLTVDIPYPVTTRFETLDRNMRSHLAAYGVEAVVLQHMPPHHVEQDSVLVKGLTAAYQQVTGSCCAPLVIGGGTYARAMKNFVAFGPLFPGRAQTEHQANESIHKKDFEMLREIYRYALIRLCT